MKLLLPCLLMCITSFCTAQSNQDSLLVKKGSNFYRNNGEEISYPELVSLTSSNKAAYDQLWRAKSNSEVANVFGMLGGALIGWPVGTAIAGGKPQWALAEAGVGLIAIALPFAFTANKQTIKAIKIYNEGIKVNAKKNLTLKPGIYNDGIGICLRF